MSTVKIEVGSISTGTLRTVDLLRSFADELSRILDGDPDNPLHSTCEEAFATVERINGGADETEADSDLLQEITEALEYRAPAGMYFGNTEGDGSDFGWWLNEAGRRAALADEFSRAFERRTRDNGDSFVCLKDGAPEWMQHAVQEGHGDMLPDDWRYRLIESIVDGIADALRSDCDADLDDARHEIIDLAIPIYNGERLQWLASSLGRAAYCDEAREEGLVAEDADMFDRIAAGIYRELEEIYSSIVDAINSEAE